MRNFQVYTIINICRYFLSFTFVKQKPLRGHLLTVFFGLRFAKCYDVHDFNLFFFHYLIDRKPVFLLLSAAYHYTALWLLSVP